MTYVMIEDSDGEWGISRSGSNPERDDFVLCGSRSDAERLSRWLNEEPTRLQLEALLDAIERCQHAPRDNEPTSAPPAKPGGSVNYVGYIAKAKDDGSLWMITEHTGDEAEVRGIKPEQDGYRTILCSFGSDLLDQYEVAAPGPDADRLLLADYAARLRAVEPPQLTSPAARDCREDARLALETDVIARLEAFEP